MDSKILIKSKKLSDKYNSSIYLKPQYYTKTQSHKDLWAKSAIKYIVSKNIKKIVLSSSGNLGLAIAAVAFENNIECQIISWSPILSVYEKLFQKYDVNLKLVQGIEEESKLFKIAKADGYFNLGLSSLERENKNLIGVEGFKVIALEIYENLQNKDLEIVIILPCSFGDLATGILKGFEDLVSSKNISKLPKFILVRANFENGNLARSIATNDTMPQVKKVLSKSCGESIYLNNKEFLNGKKIANEELNLDLELTSCGVFESLNKINVYELENKNVILILTALDRK